MAIAATNSWTMNNSEFIGSPNPIDFTNISLLNFFLVPNNGICSKNTINRICMIQFKEKYHSLICVVILPCI